MKLRVKIKLKLPEKNTETIKREIRRNLNDFFSKAEEIVIEFLIIKNWIFF